MIKIKLGIDIDEVVCKLMDSMLPLVNYENDTVYDEEDITEYNLQVVGIKEPGKLLKKYKNMFKTAKAVDGADRFINRLYKDGHKIILISKRDSYDGIYADTIQWFKKKGIPFDKMLLYQKNKVNKAHMEKIDIFIDDKAETVEQMQKSGIDSYVFDRPWNKNYKHLKRVYSWGDIYDEVRKKT